MTELKHLYLFGEKTVEIPAGQAIVSDPTEDLTAYVKDLSIDTDQNCTFWLQHSTDGAVTWEYWPNDTGWTRTIGDHFDVFADGILRLLVLNNSASAATIGADLSAVEFEGYCTVEDVRIASGLVDVDVSDAYIQQNIELAGAEIDAMAGTKFKSTSFSETLDGNGTQTMAIPYGPVRTITSLTINGTSITPSNVYVYPQEMHSMITLSTSAEQTRFLDSKPQLVVIEGTYGCLEPDGSVPETVRRLCAVKASIAALTRKVSRTSDEPSNYNIRGFGVAYGEPSINYQRSIDELKKQEKILKAEIPRIIDVET